MSSWFIKGIQTIADMVSAVRRYYYRKKLGVSRLDIYFPVFISNTDNIRIGEDCAIASFVHIWSNEVVTIGAGCIIAAHVQITTSTHDYRHAPYRAVRVDKPVTLGKNVWIGGGAIVMPGVRIGDNAVVGAGAVVTRDIPANCVAFGVPARVVKQLDHKYNGIT